MTSSERPAQVDFSTRETRREANCTRAVLVGANKRILGLLGAIRSICKITETVLVLPM